GVEDAVAAVHHVVVERDDHQRGVGHDSAELARVERPVLDRLAGPERPELVDYVTGRQHWQSGRHRHDGVLHAAMYHLNLRHYVRVTPRTLPCPTTKVLSSACARRVLESRVGPLVSTSDD